MSFLERRRLAAFSADIQALRAELQAEVADSVLDVGGGTGAVTEAIARGVPRIVVVEPSLAKRERGSKRRPEIDFQDGSAEKLPSSDSSFDVVLSFVAFHHFRAQREALREMRRTLSPSGRLILFEFRPEQAPGRFWGPFVGHTHFMGPEDLAQLVREAGFTNVRAAPTPSGYFVVGRR